MLDVRVVDKQRHIGGQGGLADAKPQHGWVHLHHRGDAADGERFDTARVRPHPCMSKRPGPPRRYGAVWHDGAET